MARLAALVGIYLTTACTGLPWGSGGAAIVAEEREIPGGIVRHFGSDALARASARLALDVAERWAEIELPDETYVNGLVVAWDGLELELGGLELALGADGLEARVELAAAPTQIGIGLGDVLSCTLDIGVGPGLWVVPLQLAPDKLGRVQGAVKATGTFQGEVTIGVSDGACPVIGDLGERVAKALAQVAGDALGQPLADALAPALGLDFALSWSGSVAPDALGTGFIRASIRAREDDLFTASADGLQVRFAVGVEAEPHPCVAPLAMPLPDADGPEGAPAPRGDGLEGAVAVRLVALEQALAAAWIAGMVCGDHADAGAGVTVDELAGAWPALAAYPRETPLRLELWPEELPTLTPGDAGGIRLDTGRIVIEIWAEDGGTWRVGTLTVSVAIEGELTATPDGFVWLDPSRIEAWPSEVAAGLVAAPPSAAAAEILAPLVEALVLARPILRLPPSVRPSAARILDVGLDHVMLVP